jgi:hypothetical protein
MKINFTDNTNSFPFLEMMQTQKNRSICSTHLGACHIQINQKARHLLLMKSIGVILTLLLFTTINSFGQSLFVNLTNSTTDSYLLSNVRSITFNQNSMMVNEYNGSNTAYQITNIINYTFGGTITNLAPQVSDVDIDLFPNPITTEINISVKRKIEGQSSVKIWDVTGNLIADIYEGQLLTNQVYRFKVDAKPGNYYCTIQTTQKTISKPIIIIQ